MATTDTTQVITAPGTVRITAATTARIITRAITGRVTITDTHIPRRIPTDVADARLAEAAAVVVQAAVRAEAAIRAQAATVPPDVLALHRAGL